MNKVFIASFCLLTVYLLSAFGKVQNIEGTAKYLQSKLTFLPISLCIIGIIGVILLQSVGSATILYSAYTNQFRKLAYYAVLGFIAFNIAATAIFHFPPVGDEYNNFFKNLSITGGFILLLDKFN
jgi:uncharacterized membrane protein YphA (DoxX/SURF4 family)